MTPADVPKGYIAGARFLHVSAIGQAISGRPQRSWRTFGVDERMRVPWPAARITTVGAAMPGS